MWGMNVGNVMNVVNECDECGEWRINEFANYLK
jgi:hypothetical protein